MKIYLILNGYNLRRLARGLPGHLRDSSRSLGHEAHVAVSSSIDHFNELVGQAIARGAELLLIGGGDGSLHHAVNHPEARRVTMGCLPMGTINAFLRSFGMRLRDPAKALPVLLNRGRMVRGNCGLMNGRRFCCFASWGFDARVVHRNPAELKRWLRAGSYGVTGLRELIHGARHENGGTVSVNGRERVWPKATSAVVSKIRNYAGSNAFGAGVESPDLEGVICETDTPGALLNMTRYLACRGPARGAPPPRQVHRIGGFHELLWTSDHPADVQLDGEPVELPGADRLDVSLDPVEQRYLVL